MNKKRKQTPTESHADEKEALLSQLANRGFYVLEARSPAELVGDTSGALLTTPGTRSVIYLEAQRVVIQQGKKQFGRVDPYATEHTARSDPRRSLRELVQDKASKAGTNAH